MYISCDEEESACISCLPLQVDQVEENMNYASACKRQIDLVDADIVVWQHGFSCHRIKYFLNAEKTRVRFAVYEGEDDRGRLREVEGG